jgi:hypothetical protein
VSTEPTTISDFDLDIVLRLVAPQASALARHEHITPMLRRGARAMIESPSYALEVLGPRDLAKLGRALRALGEQHVANAERMLELAGESDGDGASAPPMPNCWHNTERE